MPPIELSEPFDLPRRDDRKAISRLSLFYKPAFASSVEGSHPVLIVRRMTIEILSKNFAEAVGWTRAESQRAYLCPLARAVLHTLVLLTRDYSTVPLAPYAPFLRQHFEMTHKQLPSGNARL